MKKQTLIEYMLDVDVNDPNALNDAKQKLRMAKRNPTRAIQQQQRDAKEKMQSVQRQDNSPTKNIDLKIARLKAQIATLNKQKATMAKRSPTPTVKEGIEDCGCSEVVYTDEFDNIIHEGTLTETAEGAYKRYGNVIKKQYRCTSGPKTGKIVANPIDCNKPKNKKRIKAGKKAARKSKSLRIAKSKMSRKKSISKMVTKLNNKLEKRNG